MYSLSDGFCHSNAAQNNLSPQGLCDGIHGQGQQNLSLTSAKTIHSSFFKQGVFSSSGGHSHSSHF